MNQLYESARAWISGEVAEWIPKLPEALATANGSRDWAREGGARAGVGIGNSKKTIRQHGEGAFV